MKPIKKLLNAIFALAIIASVVSINSCRKEDDNISSSNVQQSQTTIAERNCTPQAFPITGHPYGMNYKQWGEAFFKWQYAIDCSQSPYYDTDGSKQNQNQSGPVYFLGGSPLGQVLDRYVTIPAGKSLFVPMIYYFDNTGCGEPESNLTPSVSGFVPLMDQLVFTIDGNSLSNVTDFHTISCKFNFVGNSCFYNAFCIDGTQQKAVIGGYYVILRPLCPGQHIIHAEGGASTVFPPIKNVTWHITQL